MKQILQDLRTGRIVLADVPRPNAGPSRVIVQTTSSLISSGTERMLLEFGSASLLAKARQQPDKVRQSVEKMKADGFFAAIEGVRSKLEQPLELGYCNAGTVVDIGDGVVGVALGDRVVCNGPHAEFVSVPQNLCVRVPREVDLDSAAFAPIGAVALQSVRLLVPTLGETVAVIGLGLVGLLGVQLLRAAGCRVLGIDFNQERLELAKSYGAIPLSADGNVVENARAQADEGAVDGVLVATATGDDGPLRQAAEMCRVRGRVVLVGTSGLNLSRKEWFDKELSFQVSRSYGPGRYDKQYESSSIDLPMGYVRWSAKRNLSAFINLVAEKQVDVQRLISTRIDFSKAGDAYELLVKDRSNIGILLKYRQDECAASVPTTVALTNVAQPLAVHKGNSSFDVIGAGNYGSRVLLPALKRCGASLGTLVTASGVSAAHHGRRFGFANASSDVESVLSNDHAGVFVLTRHDSHAELTRRAVQVGKAVYVEKPLAITVEELNMLWNICNDESETCNDRVMVGFNRRFAPTVMRMKKLLNERAEPATFVYTVNAGVLPEDHWLLDQNIGGGRIIGEVCHFIDLLRYLSGKRITEACVAGLKHLRGTRLQQSVSIGLRMADGSIGMIHYLANGPRSFPKERLDVFCGGAALALDNFRSLKCFDWRGARDLRSLRQDKGHRACVEAFVRAVRDGTPIPVPFDEASEASQVAILLNQRWQALESGWCVVDLAKHACAGNV